ncbi:hypothetical protein V5E97_19790 [Singulisphaera sp. Ch08]|uniref:Type II secretion system protein GspG C-terminal domain-containing protein n=1 Tax=Singulisphaera sp. Ch08 TaxID=3120278 RepID=A0AAU7CSL8_9BACT
MATREEASGRKSRRGWIGLVALLIALMFVPLVWLLMPRRFLGETLPSPNGYDDLIAAGRLVTGDIGKVADLDKANTNDLRALVEVNSDALARAQIGLGRKSAVPLAKSPSVEAHLEGFNTLRSLGRLLAAEAALREHEGRTADAAKLYFGVILYGRAMSTGGLIHERLAAGAIQYAGIRGLNRLAPTLSAEESRRLAREVERLDRAREPLDHVFNRDQEFHLARRGLSMQIGHAIYRKQMQAMLMPTKAAAKQSDRLNQTELRLLAATLALRAYRLDHPDEPVPPSLDALVPTYLEAIPFDPFSQGPMTFKAQGDVVRIYSVGPNGRDDGGIASPSRNSFVGDLLLESP